MAIGTKTIIAAIFAIAAAAPISGCTIFGPVQGQTTAEQEFEQLADVILDAELAAIIAYDRGEISQATWDHVIAPAFFEAQDIMVLIADTGPGERRTVLHSEVRRLLREIARARASPDEGT